jgi:ankyrin repeat protein
LIQTHDYRGLHEHLNRTRGKFDLNNSYNKSGFTPLLYAAEKNNGQACEILINFLLCSESDSEVDSSRGSYSGKKFGGSGETSDSEFSKQQARKIVAKNWINTSSKGEDGFTALHQASFRGNLKLIQFLLLHGANMYAINY